MAIEYSLHAQAGIRIAQVAPVDQPVPVFQYVDAAGKRSIAVPAVQPDLAVELGRAGGRVDSILYGSGERREVASFRLSGLAHFPGQAVHAVVEQHHRAGSGLRGMVLPAKFIPAALVAADRQEGAVVGVLVRTAELPHDVGSGIGLRIPGPVDPHDLRAAPG